jgi:hypothetical protein
MKEKNNAVYTQNDMLFRLENKENLSVCNNVEKP